MTTAVQDGGSPKSKILEKHACDILAQKVDLHFVIRQKVVIFPIVQQSAEDHHLKIHSIINQTSDNMIRACGALLKYLDKNRVGGFNLESGGVPILAVKQFTPQDIVRIDETSLTALQIFSLKWQTSGARAGSWNQKREGLSIFKV